jgi:hypothetical protein
VVDDLRKEVIHSIKSQRLWWLETTPMWRCDDEMLFIPFHLEVSAATCIKGIEVYPLDGPNSQQSIRSGVVDCDRR